MNILVATTNFGLGPVSKLYSILQEILKMKDISVTFLGNGLSLDFIKRNFGNKITYKICDTDNINETELLEIADFEKYNLFINVMNINIPKIQKSKKIKIKSV
ncbi:MAG: hypothetical protein Q4B52_08245, partial [Tissierellia bacterium]|nr:hypothetical protein [Tissierellia bacterium]